MGRPAGSLAGGSGLAVFWLLAILGPGAPNTVAWAQEAPTPGTQPEREFRMAPPGTIALKLAHGFVEASSLQLYVEGRRWEPDVDFRLRSRSGLIIPLRSWVTAVVDSVVPDRKSRALVMVSYDFLPVPVPARRDLRPVSAPPDRQTGLLTRGLGGDAAAAGDWRTGDLQVSGSKTIQVSSGSRREMTVDQNLRLSIAGQLTPEISVRAFLSDDNLPVVPEGNTEELRDIDKVLVELTAPEWRATLGDFVARREGTTFGDYRRKLQGISLTADPGPTEFEVLAGSPRGRYRTLQVRGRESNQGPYFLGGSGAAGNLFIVAGSERVTLDQQVLTRGADRDYVIDYITGTITFTYRRLVTAESTIVVEFEEGEGPYGRTVVGGGAGIGFEVPVLAAPGRFRARVIRERDDPGRLRTGTLGDEDEAILRAAGDDLSLAVAGGVTATAPGEGAYLAQVAGGKTIYVFSETGGDFNLDLFYVGPGQGDYRLQQLTAAGSKVFEHLGDGLGNYRIGRPIPLPAQQSVATLTAVVGDTAGSHVVGEWNAGTLDRNQLSPLDNDDNSGTAGRVVGQLVQQPLGAGGVSLGQIDLAAAWEQKDDRFRPFQVRRTIFDYAEWGLDDRARRAGFLDDSERQTELGGTWRSAGQGDRLEVSGHAAALRHGTSLTADQIEGRAEWQWRGGRGRHRLQKARADDALDPLAIRRTERSHDLSWRLGPIVPSVQHKLRRWRDGLLTGPRAGGFQLEEYGAGLASRPDGGLSWNLGFVRGLADSLHSDNWRRARDSRTSRAGVSTGRFGGMRLVGEGTLRQIKQPDGPVQTTRLGRMNLSGSWARTASDWSLGYRVENSRSEVLNRQIVFVGEGIGDFDADGRYLGAGQGDHNMVLVGTDSLVATTGVAADLNWRQGFRFLGEDRWYGAWTANTLAGLDARSTTDDVGGLLALTPGVVFDKRTAVLGDLNFSEELVLLQHLRTIDLRGRFGFRETIDRQFADHPEDRTARNWQLTGNLNLTRRTALKLRWQREDDRRYTAEGGLSSRRSFLINSRRYEAGWNYSPTTDLRLGLQGEYLQRDDAVSTVAQRELALRPSGRARWHKVWTLVGDVRVADVASDEPAGTLRPYFFAQPGTNVEATLRLAWDPSDYLTVGASWFAQKRGERRWQHDVRLETTARF